MQQSLNELKTEIVTSGIKKPDQIIDRVFAALDLSNGNMDDPIIKLPGDFTKKIVIDGGVLKVIIECTASDANIKRANHLKEAAICIVGVEPDRSGENPDQMGIEDGIDSEDSDGESEDPES